MPSGYNNLGPRTAAAGDFEATNSSPLLRNYKKGNVWFVDAVNGDDDHSGKSWGRAFLTMQEAFDHLASGDTIYFSGKIREQLTTPVQIFDVTIVGQGNRPRHADAEPAGGNLASNTWTTPASPTAATPLCKVLQQGWRFVNVLFAGPSDAACVQLFRNGGSGDAERDASHAEFINCRFASGQNGVEGHGGPGHVGIYDSYFTSLTGAALLNTLGAGIGTPFLRWQIVGNRFQQCATIMTAAAATDLSIQGNSFMFTAAPTLVFDFTGGGRNNVGGITRNSFNIAAADFDPAGGVTGSGATDVWSNVLTDAIETGLPAN